jgi:hypothetical protein
MNNNGQNTVFQYRRNVKMRNAKILVSAVLIAAGLVFVGVFPSEAAEKI